MTERSETFPEPLAPFVGGVEEVPGPFPAVGSSSAGSFLLPRPEFRTAARLREETGRRLFPSAPALFPWLERAFAPGRATGLVGPPPLVGRFLPFLLATVAAHGAEVSLRDGTNRFAPYAIGALARRWGVDVEEVLGRVRVARAFTAHQMVRLVESWEDTLLERPTLPHLLVATDPTLLCQDAEVPPDESTALQIHMARRLGRLARTLRRPLLLAQERTGGGGRLLFPGLAREGPRVHETLRLDHGRDGTVLLTAVARAETRALLALPPHQRHLEEFDPALAGGGGLPATLERSTEVTPWAGLFPPTATR